MIDLFRAVKLFADAKVDFVVVGGVAVRSHGTSYITEDLDLCYSRTTENIKTIADVLRPFNPRPRGFPEDLPFIFDWSTINQGTNFTFKTDLGDIDLLGEVKGIGGYSEIVKEAITVDLDGSEVKILSINGLIKAKEAAGREKDVAGLKVLYALQEALSDED